MENITKAQRLIKEFEEQKYSTRKIHNNDIHLFTEQDVCKRKILVLIIFLKIQF